MNILSYLKKIKKSWDKNQPLIEVVIFRQRILDNLSQYQARFPALKFAPVLKSNAYGHGLNEVAKILDQQSLPFFVIDSLFEAKTLRRGGIKTPLLIVGYVLPANINRSRLNKTAFTIVSLDQLRQLAAGLRRPAAFHLKIDTGMRRQGILPEQIDLAVKLIRSNVNIRLAGICSHLADADNQDSSLTLKQITEWNQAVNRIKVAWPGLEYFHLAASAGTRYSDRIHANVARLGIGLYAPEPGETDGLNLSQALQMRSLISGIKNIEPGDSVGYGATFSAAKHMTLATVPAGYFEGIDRRLSGRGYFLVADQACPIVGRVSMNITTIDVSQLPGIPINQSVIIIGSEPDNPNNLANMAKTCGTIVRELLVHIPPHLKRMVIE